GLLLIPLLTTLIACATAVDYALLSKDSYEQHKYDKAIINANLAIEKDPDYSYSWLWLGMSQLKKNQYQEAINSLSKAGQLNSDTDLQKSISYHIGYAYYRISDCDNAITFYNQNIALGPDWMSYLHRSYCYMDKAMFDEALSDAYHAIQHIESKNDNFKIQAYRVIAFANLGLGNTKKASSIIKQLQEKFPLYDTWEDQVAVADITNNKQDMAILLQSRGWLGLESVDYLDNTSSGVKIDSFLYNNPSTETELHPGDIIISLNNTSVTNSRVLNKTIKLQKPGQPVHIKALRPGKTAQQAESSTSDLEELEFNITVKPVPASVALDTLKEHPYHSVIDEKKNHYKAARDALNSGNHKKAFELYMVSAPKHWMDSETLSNIIELYWKTGKQIAASEKANKEAFFANKTKNEIKNIIDLNKTINMYSNIIQTTPWWAEMHYTLATLYERRQDYQLAANSLKLYLISAIEDNVEVVSGESRFTSIQKKIFDLEYKASNTNDTYLR
ncbi:MAG: PDZ domain-containing protein, partial [Gammaproteobacteria bacterium]|nr:PDZ domain-containing protein [Gammaproteobacteria bacterium]